MTMDAGTSGGDAGAATGGAPPPAAGEPSGGEGIHVGRSVGDGDDGGDAAESRAKSKDAKDAAAAVARYKARINGAEVEHDGATLARMLSDDFEHEFPGPGGKPHKATRAAMVRLAQQGLGFEGKMTKLSEERARFAAAIEAAKADDGARVAFLMSHLGVEDPDLWILKRAEHLEAKRDKIAELIRTGRSVEAVAVQQELIQERMERGKQIEKLQQGREAEQRRSREAMQAHQGRVREALEKEGVDFGDETFRMAEAAHQHWSSLGYQKTYAEIAQEVAKAQRDAFHTKLRRIPREKLLDALPPDWRRTMRELEAEAAGAAKKEERAAKRDADEPTRRQESKDDRISEAEYARRQKAGR